MALLKRKVKAKTKAEKKPKVEAETKGEIMPVAGKGTKQITLRNEFHKTETKISVADNGVGTLSKKEVKEIKDKLYGDGCDFCGNELGMRGHQDFTFRLDPLEDEGIQITIIE